MELCARYSYWTPHRRRRRVSDISKQPTNDGRVVTLSLCGTTTEVHDGNIGWLFGRFPVWEMQTWRAGGCGVSC
jgi:hypothetical protein